MLTEKDYCDYETCVALKELGFNNLVDWYFNEEKSIVSSLARYRNTYIPRISLYEAQKWLREEKNIIVEVFIDDDSDTPITYNIYKDGECVCHHHGTYWSVKEWSEALSEGIKEAVKILTNKENE